MALLSISVGVAFFAVAIIWFGFSAIFGQMENSGFAFGFINIVKSTNFMRASINRNILFVRINIYWFIESPNICAPTKAIT